MPAGLIYKSKVAFRSHAWLKDEARNLINSIDNEKSQEKLSYIAQRDFFLVDTLVREVVARNDAPLFEKLLKFTRREEQGRPGTYTYPTWMGLAFELNNHHIADVVLRNPDHCDVYDKEAKLAHWLWSENKDGSHDLFGHSQVRTVWGNDDVVLSPLERSPKGMITMFDRNGTDMELVRKKLIEYAEASMRENEKNKKALAEKAEQITEKNALLNELLKIVPSPDVLSTRQRDSRWSKR